MQATLQPLYTLPWGAPEGLSRRAGHVRIAVAVSVGCYEAPEGELVRKYHKNGLLEFLSANSLL